MTDSLDQAIQREMPRYLTNQGHGHVWARPDGSRARCGGQRMCPECALDAVDLAAARQAVTERLA